ncbi:MAG: hypothetical protein K2X77_05700 [Candidatus Obscuribacterales bacterium]|nr:hypothetical protein [Candidatus Obscuribacterales bacterium]
MQRRFQYNASWKLVFMVCGFFGLATAVLANQALHNDRGAIIEGIFALDTNQATIFYWLLTAGSGIFVLMGILIAARRMMRPVELILDEKELVLPSGFMQRTTARIPYSEVIAATEIDVSGQKMVSLQTAQKQYTISSTLLGDHETFELVKTLLSERIPNGRLR